MRIETYKYRRIYSLYCIYAQFNSNTGTSGCLISFARRCGIATIRYRRSVLTVTGCAPLSAFTGCDTRARWGRPRWRRFSVTWRTRTVSASTHRQALRTAVSVP